MSTYRYSRKRLTQKRIQRRNRQAAWFASLSGDGSGLVDDGCEVISSREKIMKTLSSMAVNYPLSTGKRLAVESVEQKAGWRSSPTVVINRRFEPGRPERTTAADSRHFILGYN